MKDARADVSIVIPCYNEERFLAKTLKSLLDQTYKGMVELIVVDNNCNDKTVSIAKSFGAKIIFEPRPGVCFARQAGTAAATGVVVISTDADTTFKPHWLKTIMNDFELNSRAVAVAGPCRYSDGPMWGRLYPLFLFGGVSLWYRLRKKPFYITATNVAFKKSAWQAYDTNMTQGGDELALLHDLQDKGRVVFNNSNPVYTSARRLYKGLFYNLVVTFFIYYLLAYYLNRLFNRRLIGMAPAMRSGRYFVNYRSIVYRFGILAILALFVHIPGHDNLIQQSYETVGQVVRVIHKTV